MKKYLFFASLLAVVFASTAQVHVINDAFIYSKGTDIFITQELELRDTQSAFYLREGEEDTNGDGNGKIAQLIQQDVTAQNTGLGVFSVFQEGNADNFTYNYWSSPVSLPNATTGNSGFSYTQIHFPTLMEHFDFETDYVIDAQQATFLNPSINDGSTDVQNFTDLSTPGSPMNPVVTSPLRIAKRWLYGYKSADPSDQSAVTGGGYLGWRAFQQDTDIIEPGYGFTMKGQTGNGVNIIEVDNGNFGQRYDFRGIPNNGDFSVYVANGDFSLVGNPYPSGLDLKQFMADNAGEIDGQLFFWDSASTTHILQEYEGGYGTYSPQLGIPGSNGVYVDAVFKKYDAQGNIFDPSPGGGGGLSGPPGEPNFASRRYAAIGQGFVIQRTADDLSTSVKDGFTTADDGAYGTVVFRNSQRVFAKENGDSSLFKAASTGNNDQAANANAAEIPPAMSFEVIINELYSRNMIVSFYDQSTTGWDWGMDASNIANRVSNDAFMVIDDQQAIIQTMPLNFDETTIPLGFTSSNEGTTYEIKITGRENFAPERVLVHDKLNDSYHDILNDSFTATLKKGTLTDRYEIVFQEQSTLSNGQVDVVKAFNIFQNNDRSLLTIQNPTSKNITSIHVYDLAGRLVAQQAPTNLENEYTFNTSSYAVGVYVVNVTTIDDETIATKVIISN